MPAPLQFSGGIQVPIEASFSGGFRLLSGDDYIIQTVRILCGDAESDNPFNDRVGVGGSAIFANASDTGWRAKTRKEIEDVFRDLERAQIAKLRSIRLETGSPDSGETIAIVEFLSIETNTTIEVDTTLRRG